MKEKDSSAVFADVLHQYEMISDLRHELHDLKREVEWLRLPWIVRIAYDIWQFLKAPFGEFGSNFRHGGDL